MHEEGVRPLPVVLMLCLFSNKYDADVLAHPTTRDFDYHFEDFGCNLSLIFNGLYVFRQAVWRRICTVDKVNSRV